MLNAAQTQIDSPAIVRLARQPVFDDAFEVVGYSVLVNGAGLEGADSEERMEVLSSFVSHYADRVAGSFPAFLRLDSAQLQLGLGQVLPRQRTVIEVVDSARVRQDSVVQIKQLAAQGFVIALADFALTRQVLPLLAVARYVKIDITRFTNQQLVQQIKALAAFPVKLVASNIHSHEQFELCRQLGFQFFQGTFLCRPRKVCSNTVQARRSTVTELLAKVNDPEVTASDLAAIIRTDGAMIVGLLRIVNSAFYGMNRKIRTAREAIALLGLQRIRAWVTLLSVASLEDKPEELLRSAMIRARMAELLALRTDQDKPDTFFMVGVLSMLDAVLDLPMSEIVSELPLFKEMEQALLERQGRMGRALHCIEAQERGVWSHVQYAGLSQESIQECWLEAIEWAKHMNRAVKP